MSYHNSTPASILNAPQGTHIVTVAESYGGGRPKGALRRARPKPHALSVRVQRLAVGNGRGRVPATQLPSSSRLRRIARRMKRREAGES